MGSALITRGYRFVNDHLEAIQTISRAGIGVVAVLVIGTIFGFFLWKQTQLTENDLSARNDDRDRIYDYVKFIGERNTDIMKQQVVILKNIEQLTIADQRIMREILDDLARTRKDLLQHGFKSQK